MNRDRSKKRGNPQVRAKKPFDCVEMKRGIQAEIHEEIKNLTRAQELEYWRKSAEQGPWGDWWRQLYRQAETAQPRLPERPRKKKVNRRPTHRA